MSYRSHAGLHARRLFDVVLTATIFGLVWLLPPAAQAANPAEEMFKGGRTFIDGGVDPHGDSWRSMAHSLPRPARLGLDAFGIGQRQSTRAAGRKSADGRSGHC
jgi:hypothetical protein